MNESKEQPTNQWKVGLRFDIFSYENLDKLFSVRDKPYQNNYGELLNS